MSAFDYNKWLKDEIGVQLKPCDCGNKRVKIEYFQEQLFAVCCGFHGCGKRSKALIFEGGGNTLPEPVFRDGSKIIAHLWNDGQFSSDCYQGDEEAQAE